MQLLDRAFTILQVVADQPKGAGVTTIAGQLGLAKSTTSRILNALEETGAVSRSAENLFTIGPAIFHLSANQPYPQSLTALARPVLEQLVHETDEAAALCVLDGNQVLYLDQVQAQQAVQMRDWTGSRFPLHLLAAGKLFLAFGSAEFLTNYLSNPLEKYTDQSIDSAEKLRFECATVRQVAYASTIEEFAAGTYGYAVPIFNVDGSCTVALNVFGPAFRVESIEKQDAILTSMRRHAPKLQLSLRRLASNTPS